MKKILETLKLKWAEYFLEIIVIVIGILVAFGLNEWNDTRRAKADGDKERKEVIAALYNDLQVDIKNLDFIIRTFASNHEGAISLLEVLETKSSVKLDTLELFLIVDNLKQKTRVDRKPNALDGLVSLGKLKTLKNDSLASLLLDYYANYDSFINLFNQGQNDNFSALFGESFNSEDLRKINNQSTSSHFNIRIQEWFENKAFSKIIARSGARAGAFSNFFLTIKSQAQIVSEYMDENYSDMIQNLE